ncbi:MAG: hypothetical protein GF401_03585 [Chitinivibrionales bacterium]|nr:hypothetical protein [Chitinivibrionales bacterium]
MIGKIVFLPFTLLKKAIAGVVGILKLGVLFILGIIKVIFGHVLGTATGAIIGFVLGNKHVGIKFGKKKKKTIKHPKSKDA